MLSVFGFGIEETIFIDDYGNELSVLCAFGHYMENVVLFSSPKHID